MSKLPRARKCRHQLLDTTAYIEQTFLLCRRRFVISSGFYVNEALQCGDFQVERSITSYSEAMTMENFDFAVIYNLS